MHSTYGTGGVSGSGDQATLGVAAEEVGGDTEMAKMISGAANWYRSDAGGPLTGELAEPAKAQRVYSYVVSVMTQRSTASTAPSGPPRATRRHAGRRSPRNWPRPCAAGGDTIATPTPARRTAGARAAGRTPKEKAGAVKTV